MVGFIIVRLGTMISLEDFKKQWTTFLIGVSTVFGIGISLWVASLIFGGSIAGSEQDGYAQARDFVIAGTGALSGGIISVVLVQEAALGVGLTSVAILPVLIAALQGIIGIPQTSIIRKREGARLKGEYRDRNLTPVDVLHEEATAQSKLPPAFSTTTGTLFVVGSAVLVRVGINNLTNGVLNTFVVALILAIALRTTAIFQAIRPRWDRCPRAHDDRDHDPRAARDDRARRRLRPGQAPADHLRVRHLRHRAVSALAGKLLGYSVPMSVAIGLTSLYGFPGTMILSQEAARGSGETPDEVAAIEHEILPKMIVAGFSTVTITSVIVTSILVGCIGG